MWLVLTVRVCVAFTLPLSTCLPPSFPLSPPYSSLLPTPPASLCPHCNTQSCRGQAEWHRQANKAKPSLAGPKGQAHQVPGRASPCFTCPPPSLVGTHLPASLCSLPLCTIAKNVLSACHAWLLAAFCHSYVLPLLCVCCVSAADHCMAALPWGVIIIDESHNLRTTNSRGADSPHTEAAVAAGAAAKRLVLLSGTPSLSRPYDLYRQVDVLAPGLLGRSKEEFAHRCACRMQRAGRQGWEAGPQLKHELQAY